MLGTFSLTVPDQWTARTLWTAKAAREAEASLCKRRSSAPLTASASTAETVRACPPSLRKSPGISTAVGKRLSPEGQIHQQELEVGPVAEWVRRRLSELLPRRHGLSILGQGFR